MTTALKVPYRQIRALYDDETITVYQAYSAEIAIPAVRDQKLSASSAFKITRMTWIKPSWCWMMYRSGYSYKDPNQAHILAIKMKHSHFLHLLSCAGLSTAHGGGALSADDKSRPVRVQWDPERSPSLGILPYRSIQIGISRELCERWVNEWIVSIEDVTERAKGLKGALEGSLKVGAAELVERGLVPDEVAYDVPGEIKNMLRMEEN